MAPRWLGLDVGGANLKIADGRGHAWSEPFALWKRAAELCDALQALIERFDPNAEATGVAMTMTGELADCYATKAEGVRAIVDATVQAARRAQVRVATTDGVWLDPLQAIEQPRRVAAANWRLAADLVARNHSVGRGTWIDVGSTTTDVTSVADGLVANLGSTDTERLLSGGLVYTGVRRTPVCAVVDRLPYSGRECPVAAEWFATTADAWLVLGELAEDPDDTDTADGRPFCKPEAIARLARCLCADAEGFTSNDARSVAERIAQAQIEMIAVTLPDAIDWVVVGGEGGFLARRAVAERHPELPFTFIEDAVCQEVSTSFPAHAAAVLAADQLGSMA